MRRGIPGASTSTPAIPRLTSGDWQAVNGALGELYAELDLRHIYRHMLRLVHRLIPADSIRIGRLDPVSGGLELWESAGQPLPAQFARLISQFIPAHPLVLADRGGAGGVALRMSDVTSNRAFWNTALYQEAYRLIGTRFQLSFGRWSGEGGGLGIALDRSSRDFSERERTILEVLRPHFQQALRNAGTWARRPAIATNPPAGTTGSLTRREIEVLEWLHEGKTNAEIAVVLGVSPFTVKNHLQRIFGKLGVTTRTAAAREAWSPGIRGGPLMERRSERD